jgi:bifunctional non-homologous end joining protein LigD
LGRGAKRSALPRWVEPMLATLVEPAALPDGWLYEAKLDGVRCLAFAGNGTVRLLSRNRKALDGAYPEIADALRKAVRGSAVLDGEVVAIDPARGISSFSLLQRRIGLRDAGRARRSGVPIEFWLFDCLFHDGEDLRRRPLTERQRALRSAVRPAGPIRITPVLKGPFAPLFQAACQKGSEGLIGKRSDAPYRSGRSPDWVKLKCVNAEEFVIGGWTDPRGSREVLGALLVGYYDDAGLLQFAGKVGSGYDRDTLGRLAPALARRARRSSPFAPETRALIHNSEPTRH